MIRLSRRVPSVSYRLRRSVTLAALLAALLFLGGAALTVWTVQGVGAVSWLVFCGWGLWGLAVAGARQSWRDQFCGFLRWDGVHWLLDSSQPGCTPKTLSVPPEVILDAQVCLCVCVTPTGLDRIWLWLERSSQPERWMDLRRAVYSRARPGADNADETAPANSRGA